MKDLQGSKMHFKEIGTDVKTLAEGRRESSSRLAAPTKDSDRELEENIHLVEQLLINKDPFRGHISVKNSDSKDAIIELEIEADLEEGDRVFGHGINISIDENNMSIFPHKHLTSLGMQLNARGEEKDNDPSLEKLISLIKEAIPQDELNAKQREVFNNFFKSGKAIIRYD
jgi:hypothetical protein